MLPTFENTPSFSPTTMSRRGPVSFAKPEIAALIDSLPPSTEPETAAMQGVDDEARRLTKHLNAAHERLKGNSADTNFGRDHLEAAIGAVIVSVVLSIDEIDAILQSLGQTSEPPAPLRPPLDAITRKLSDLRTALIEAPEDGSAVKAVAASVGLGMAAADGSAVEDAIVPVTVLTGCLGAGKTTVIRSLLGVLPNGYTCAWLKNGYGDAGVDAAVARDARIAVKEIVNGCLCCTKVGDLADALRALYELRPNRILVEASGSALPGQLVWEIEKLQDIVRVDGVVSVVDCANFLRINNFSRTAKIQAKCTDLVLLNKVELAGEDKVDEVLDDLNELCPDVSKVRTAGERAAADPAILFGLDGALWRAADALAEAAASAEGDAVHMNADAECFHVLPAKVPAGWSASRAALEALVASAPPDDLYRTKGIVPFSFAEAEAEAVRQGKPPGQDWGTGTNLGDTWWLFNGVAGRLTLEHMPNNAGPASLVLMGRDLKRRKAAFEKALSLPAGSVVDATISRMADMKVASSFKFGVARGLATPALCGA